MTSNEKAFENKLLPINSPSKWRGSYEKIMIASLCDKERIQNYELSKTDGIQISLGSPSKFKRITK